MLRNKVPHSNGVVNNVKPSQVKSSQVKSAPTPVGEPNVRAEAEKMYVNT